MQKYRKKQNTVCFHLKIFL